MAKDLEGKVFLVTGATEGIGKAAVREFAARGATLELVARNRAKGETLVAELKAATGNERIALLVGDMSKVADAKAVAAAFRAKHDRLDVLVNNAGAVFKTYQRTSEGFEMTFALNHLGYFVLTSELLEILRRTPGARVVSTSSGAHMMGRIDLDRIATREKKKDAGFQAYGDSKLANVLFTKELAKRLAGTGAVANCFHPGFVSSGFGLNNSGLVAAFLKRFGPMIARTPEKGAETLVWLATSPEAARFNGEYFHDRKVSRTSGRAKDDAMATKLWELSERLVRA